MSEARTDRRLAAIMAADVAGYSRLMREDETGTLRAIKALRREVFTPQVKAHRGRVVKLMGDGALVEFGSLVDAVACGISIQEDLAARNANLPQERRVELRTGVNLGDIIIEGRDIYGEGVNLAARLQQAAAPGGISLSDSAHEHAAKKVGVPFSDGGLQAFKNIAKPVRIWRWSPNTTGFPDPQQPRAGALPLPDKPSIAVLPFDNMSGDANQEYFADGVVESITAALSRIRSSL